MSRTFKPALLLLLLTLSAAPSLWAHGGGRPRLVNEAAGPYWVSVWTSPDPVRVGQLHVTVSVAEPGEGRQAGPPVLGASVRVTLSAPAGENTVTAVASNEQSANRLFYEADLVVTAEGLWAATILVTGSQGSGEARFDLQVQAPKRTNWFLFGGLALLAAGGLFLASRVRRRSLANARADERDRGIGRR